MTENITNPFATSWEALAAREVERMKDPAYAAQKREAERVEAEQRAAICGPAEDAEWQRMTAAIALVRSAANAFTGQQTPAVLAVRGWLDNGERRPGLVLRGGVGCGKTTAACYAVREWIGRPKAYRPEADGDPFRFSWRDWNRDADHQLAISAHKPRVVTWLRPDQLVSAVMHAYDERSPKLSEHIVIDDMGRETKADFAESLCEVLDTPDVSVLITTNLTKVQLRERYDLRLLDRMNDTCTAVDVPGKSLRRQDGGF